MSYDSKDSLEYEIGQGLVKQSVSRKKRNDEFRLRKYIAIFYVICFAPLLTHAGSQFHSYTKAENLDLDLSCIQFKGQTMELRRKDFEYSSPLFIENGQNDTKSVLRLRVQNGVVTYKESSGSYGKQRIVHGSLDWFSKSEKESVFYFMAEPEKNPMPHVYSNDESKTPIGFSFTRSYLVEYFPQKYSFTGDGLWYYMIRESDLTDRFISYLDIYKCHRL